MSISGEQNNPYTQPQANPYGQVPTPQNAAVPQQNPYAQQPPQQVPPVPGGGYGYPAGGIPSPPPGPPGAREGAGRGKAGWLWAIGGAVAASAIWASVLFATGGFSDGADPDLAGYGYTDDLCAKTSLTPFENAHFKIKASTSAKDANPQHTGAQQNTMDTMSCNVSLEPQNAGSSDYSSTWMYSTVTLHKKSDPAPEFADSYRSYEKQEASTRYTVEAVPGIADEAYLVTRQDTGGSSDGSYVILAVRDGWMTFQSTWSSYASSSSTAKQPTPAEVATMLKTSATETLKRLQGTRSR
ncbi:MULTISPECIES: hypothetical protein [Streptomyces]|uniref:hypothetical protein n=1 Tax=Streptomyces TaxID=1883 RepID=UPI0025557B3D|nr:hypothetical protein [Streptomyces sp. NBRC 13847]